MGFICLYVVIQKSGQKTAKSHLCVLARGESSNQTNMHYDACSLFYVGGVRGLDFRRRICLIATLASRQCMAAHRVSENIICSKNRNLV